MIRSFHSALKPPRSDPPASLSGLSAALTLSDERASIVALQTGSGWPTRLPHALAGQQAVFILKQQPEETLLGLRQRVAERLKSAEFPPQRLLWAVAPDQPADAVDDLCDLLAPLVGSQLEVLILWASTELVVEGEPEYERAPQTHSSDNWECLDPELAEGGQARYSA